MGLIPLRPIKSLIYCKLYMYMGLIPLRPIKSLITLFQLSICCIIEILCLEEK